MFIYIMPYFTYQQEDLEYVQGWVKQNEIFWCLDLFSVNINKIN
jgi:hypothetical protein